VSASRYACMNECIYGVGEQESRYGIREGASQIAYL
jgi:hypothetical protein